MRTIQEEQTMRRDLTRRDFLAAVARNGLGAGLLMAGCAGKEFLTGFVITRRMRTMPCNRNQ